VPLFIREGYGVFMQDTTFVTETGRLNNLLTPFKITAALKKNDLISTEDFKLYDGTASIMSISNYSDPLAIGNCRKNPCFFEVDLQLQLSSKSRLLQIDYSLASKQALVDRLLISELQIFYEDENICK
jgi:hypothetical protein